MIGEKSTAVLILILLTVQTALLGRVLISLGSPQAAIPLQAAKPDLASTPVRSGQPVEGFEAGDGPSIGAVDASVTLVEFSDFTCPSCAKLKPQVQALLERYPDDLRLVFRYFPLASSGLPFQTALAAECARRQDAFWPMHDRLFRRARTIESEEDIHHEARELALDMNSFTHCMTSTAAADAVHHDSEAGLGYGISGTPTLFVNGRRFVGSGSIAGVEREIQRLLAG